jgi:hypothetical protein
MSLLESVPDPRKPRGLRHRLPAILAVGIAAVAAGARSFVAIGEWAAGLDEATLSTLGLTGSRVPSESAIRRTLARLDPAALDRAIGLWMWTRTRAIDGPAGPHRVIAIDGKTVRGARDRHRHDQSAPHLVAAFDHTSGTVLGQLAVAAKSNEIPAVRDLLAGFDLTDVVVTVDAMHTQTDTAEAITKAGGDYVFTVKNNQPSVYAACKTCPGRKSPPTGPPTPATAAGSPAPSGSSRHPSGSTSPAPPRSPSYAEPPPARDTRPSKWSTSSPPPTTAPHPRPPSRPGSRGTGASRTGCAPRGA